MMECVMYLESPVGTIGLVDNGVAITALFFAGDERRPTGTTALLEQASRELAAYFAGKPVAFTVPLQTNGTAFEQSVWAALTGIPWGETRTYGDIARLIGNPKACRAVGQAVHRNPIAIIIPCHRVIGRDGTLTGYAGGLDRKKTLLSIEGIAYPELGTHGT